MRVCVLPVLLSVLLLCAVSADTPIGSDQQPLFDGPQDSQSWEITSTSGFDDDSADFTDGLVEAGSLIFTHERPQRDTSVISYSSQSPSGSTFATGSPNGDYSWSTGPDIVVSGFEFQGLDNMEILDLSLVIHLSIPDAMPSDQVMIVYETSSSVDLVTTIARTTGPIDRFSTPMKYNLVDSSDLNWTELETSSVKIDYVSDGAPDDSEVRIDSVGLEVTYLQPWYGFENIKALTAFHPESYPVMDFDPTHGTLTGLAISTCGLTPAGSMPGEWSIYDIRPPFEQKLGRIHLYTEEGSDTTLSIRADGGDWVIWPENTPLPQINKIDVSLVIREGCISKLRVDINDPQLVVSGNISGATEGLVSDLSTIRVAMGNELVHESNVELGIFHYDMPVGRFLPSHGDELTLGLGARFQWSSDGSAEEVVLRVNDISISGGYTVDIDRSPTCQIPADQSLVEDEGGVSVSILSACEDDRDNQYALHVNAVPRNNGILNLEMAGNDLLVQPITDSSGTTIVDLQVSDSSGNMWVGSFTVNVDEVADPPAIIGLPESVTIELGKSLTIPILVSDPDTDDLTVTTSRSWATYQGDAVVLSPNIAGPSLVVVTVGDGVLFTASQINVLVKALPVLEVTSFAFTDDTMGSGITPGMLIDFGIVLSNVGHATAFDIDVHCRSDGILYETIRVPVIRTQELVQIFCSVPAPLEEGPFLISAEIDSKDQIVSQNSDLLYETTLEVVEVDVDGGLTLSDNLLVIASIVILGIIPIIAFTLGPSRVNRPYK